MRTEKDFIGSLELDSKALYGIHSLRAKENFPDRTVFQSEWYKAMGMVKQACYLTYEKFSVAVKEKYAGKKIPVPLIDAEKIRAMEKAALEVQEGQFEDHFIVPAISGGAGTSINMNINEIIANRALQILGKNPGEYNFIDPIEEANVFQSTNDVVPTALRIALMQQLGGLEDAINRLRQQIELVESGSRKALRLGYTQMQEAVPSSYGKLFSSYNDALSRDWWRVSKGFERIKTVNLGGSAIGTGLGSPRYFVMEVVSTLQRLSGLPVSRGENMSDATNNLDSFVELHAILKSHAVNLEKMVNDIRLLASDLSGSKEIHIPKQQVGSSIMPGKVNPVIPEFVVSAAHKIYANDQMITSLCAQGCLDLNAYIPTIGHALIESLKLLTACNDTLLEKLFKGISISEETARDRLLSSPAISTALSPFIGYHKAADFARMMKEEGIDVFAANKKLNYLSENKLQEVLKADNLLKTGYSIKDLEDSE